jgi:hypothetical protein
MEGVKDNPVKIGATESDVPVIAKEFAKPKSLNCCAV